MDEPSIRILAIGGAVLVSVVFSAVFAAMRNRGIVRGAEPEARLLKQAGDAIGLAYMPADRGASLSGSYRGVNVLVEAKWWSGDSSRRRWGRKPRVWTVQTTLRAAFGVQMPDGMHLRRQSTFGKFADALVNGDEILIEDKRFDDAFLVHGNDVDAVGRVLQPAARAALLKLANQGDVWVDAASVRLIVPQYVSSMTGVSRLLDALVATVTEMRGTAGPPAGADEVPVPATMRLRRTSLAALLRKAISAGGRLTDTGRAELKSLNGMQCIVEVDVEHVSPWRSPRTGRADGIAASGVLVGSTGRVDLQIDDAIAAALGPVERGDRLRAEAVIENYDPITDRSEASCDGPVERVSGGRPSELSGNVPSPAAAQATAALDSGTLDDLLKALYVGRDARERLVTPLQGRRFTLGGTIVDAIPTPPLRVNDARLRGGLTVQLRHPAVSRPVCVRFPATRNDWLNEQSIGAEMEVEVEFVEWDDIAEAAMFHEVG